MPTLHPKARTLQVPGLSIIALLALFACAGPRVPVGFPDVEAEPVVEPVVEPGPGEPSIEIGLYTTGQEAEFALLLPQAQSALDAQDFEFAEARALEVEAEFGTVPGSAYALWIHARAAEGLGKPEEALDLVRRFRTYLTEEDERLPEMALLEGDALLTLGRTAEAVAAWLPAQDEPVSEESFSRVEGQVQDLTESELVELVDSGEGIVAPVLAEYAFRQYTSGVAGSARRTAARALDYGARGRAELLALAVLSGDVSEFFIETRLGAILPTSGSPSLRQFADGIEEGIRVALEIFGQAGGIRAETELVIQDSGGDIIGARIAFSGMETSDVLGVIGPLQEGALAEVAAQVQGPLAVISPTSPVVPEGSTGVYSLSSADPGAARALARYAISSDLYTAVVIYPESTDGAYEARAFSEAFQSYGGLLLDEISYPTGAFFFEEQLRRAEALLPDVLVLPLPARDVEVLAPQVTFYGLDSLEIRILGTNGWREEAMLSRVDTRYTNGVVTASPQPAEGQSDGYLRFVESYESYYQRTLPDQVPALGYDAAGLLLEGIRRGASTQAELLETLETMPVFSGATGRLFVDDGRVVRDHFMGCLQDGQVLNLPDGARADPILSPPLRDPETDSIPEGALDRVIGFRCPVTLVPSVPVSR
ncbi:MAG: ABC transporter substrate-binding protein [Gemmatimonadetes bacterium]|nr:ABC transporter substrate-binding protein [Gemmatimonadota bacterium]